MFRRIFHLMLFLLSAPAAAQADDMQPVPPQALLGHAYFGEGAPSEILFINVRGGPVRILWIDFDGIERFYDELAQGQQVLQPTFVAHRWIVRDEAGAPLEGFIATRATATSDGTPQIAIIR